MTPFPFFVGRGRSGTTLLRAIFDSHPELAIPHESHFVVTMGMNRKSYEAAASFDAARFTADLEGTGFSRWGLEAGEVVAELEGSGVRSYEQAVRSVYSLYARGRGKSRYADKTPIYVLHIDYLAGLFEEARFVHVIRDGRNVALSYLDVGFGPSSLHEAAIYWRRFVTAGRSAGQRLGARRYTEVRYEDLVANPEAQVRRLCDFLHLDFAPAMLNYFERADAIVGALPHHKNLYRPPSASLRDWRVEMPPGDTALFESLAGGLLEDLGYEPGTRPSPAVRARAAWARVEVNAQRALRRAGSLRARTADPKKVTTV